MTLQNGKIKGLLWFMLYLLHNGELSQYQGRH